MFKVCTFRPNVLYTQGRVCRTFRHLSLYLDRFYRLHVDVLKPKRLAFVRDLCKQGSNVSRSANVPPMLCFMSDCLCSFFTSRAAQVSLILKRVYTVLYNIELCYWSEDREGYIYIYELNQERMLYIRSDCSVAFALQVIHCHNYHDQLPGNFENRPWNQHLRGLPILFRINGPYVPHLSSQSHGITQKSLLFIHTGFRVESFNPAFETKSNTRTACVNLVEQNDDHSES